MYNIYICIYKYIYINIYYTYIYMHRYICDKVKNENKL